MFNSAFYFLGVIEKLSLGLLFSEEADVLYISLKRPQNATDTKLSTADKKASTACLSSPLMLATSSIIVGNIQAGLFRQLA